MDTLQLQVLEVFITPMLLSWQFFLPFNSYFFKKAEHLSDFLCYDTIHFLIREGVKKNINYLGGIFHGALTPPPPAPLPWKIINFFVRDSRHIREDLKY